MDMEDCSICLDSLENSDNYTLACNHVFHLECYQKCVYKNNFNLFIKCPLCRELNIKNTRPYDNSYDNLMTLTRLERCLCKTKSNRRCKKKASLLNNGMCSIHQKPVKDKYDLMCNFIYYLMESNNKISTKITMIDIGSKLCSKYPEMNSVQDILHYFFRFYYHVEQSSIVPKIKVYEYYDFISPPENHVTRCLQKNILF